METRKKRLSFLSLMAALMFIIVGTVSANAAVVRGVVEAVVPANCTIAQTVVKTVDMLAKAKGNATSEQIGRQVISIQANLPKRLHKGQSVIIHTSEGKVVAKVVGVITGNTTIQKMESYFKTKSVSMVINSKDGSRAVLLTTNNTAKVKVGDKIRIMVNHRSHMMMEGC